MPPQIAADRHYKTRRAELGHGHYVPRRFGGRSRHRFDVARRRAYLARIGGTPSHWQSSTIASLVALEWSALSAEAQVADLAAAREAREHRRLFQRLLADFERSVAPPAAAKPPSLDDHLRMLAERGRRSGEAA